jgi:hypothetical protein
VLAQIAEDGEPSSFASRDIPTITFFILENIFATSYIVGFITEPVVN